MVLHIYNNIFHGTIIVFYFEGHIVLPLSNFTQLTILRKSEFSPALETTLNIVGVGL